MDLPEINRRSDDIIQVRAESVSSRWVYGKEGRNIFTTTNFRVTESIKGHLRKNDIFTLDMPGGKVGDTTQYVTTSVLFNPGEESILFLENNTASVTGGFQGNYPVSEGKVFVESQRVPQAQFIGTLKAAQDDPGALPAFLQKVKVDPIHVTQANEAAVPLKSGTSTTDTYAVSGIKSSFVGVTDNDNDGYYENYSFNIQINGDAIPGPATVYFKINCTTTGQSWTSTNSSIVTGSVVDYHPYAFTPSRFTGVITGNTELQFTVEMLDATQTTVLATDATVTGDAIKVDIPPAAALSIVSISPDMQSAGTNGQVTITGSSFGSTQGSGKVEFFYRDGQPKIAAGIISWSDTQIICTVPTGIINNYAAAAASGAVSVTNNAGQPSNDYLYRVSFAYGGTKWNTSSVSYRINENLSSVTGEGQCIQNAANSWNAANGNFKFVYGGTHTNTAISSNGYNDICWGDLGSSTIIGQASVWYSGSTIIENDIVFNSALAWNSGSSSVDIETIALHELGHWLNLRDLYGSYGDNVYDQAKAMYGFSYYGAVKRNLHSDDMAGLIWIYGMAQSVNISGYVKTGASIAVSGVVLNGFPGTIQTNANGYYTADVATGWTGTVTPVKAGYTFYLPAHNYSNQSASVTDQDFTATLVNNDASLSDLKVSGTTVSGFSPTVLIYDITLAKGTSVVPAVTATTTDASATKVITPAVSLPGSTTVVVTAADGTTKKTYTVNFLLPKNNDASLSDLTVSGTTVTGFSKTTLTYNVQLPFGTSTVPAVTAVTSDANATRTIAPPVSLPGTTTVQVTAEDGTTKLTYLINFTVVPASTDATLSDLKVNGTTVSVFSPSVLSYDVVLPTGTVTVPAVTAVTSNTAATKVITGASTLPGTTSVIVTAQDGTTKKTYTVNFSVAKNNDASLSDLKVSGTTIAGFSKTTLVYAVVLPFGTSVVPAVTATVSDANATKVITPAAALPGATTVVVTAENGSTMQTYTVNFTLETPSSEANLSDLKINGTTLAGFNPAVVVYNIELPTGTVTVPPLSATTVSSFATMNLHNATGLPGASTVQVTAQDGTTKKTYTVNFTVAKNSDASLSDLKVNGVTVPGFSRTILVYNIVLPFGTSSVPTVTATVYDANATRVITPAGSLPGSTTVLVTAENGTTTQLYTISFSVDAGSSEATLSDLLVNGVTVQGFNPTVLLYTTGLPYGTATIPTVAAFTTNPGATRVIHQATTLPGAATVVVTSQNGSATKTYTINFIVAKNNDATLSDLKIDGTTVAGFSRNNFNYSINLPYGTSVIPQLSATTTDANAFRNITQATGLPGVATVVVTAEDGVTVSTYRITFTLSPPSSDALLSSMQIDGVPLAGFDPNSISYQVILPHGTIHIPDILAVTQNLHSTVVIMRANALPGVTSVQVTAQDAVTTKTYSVYFTLARNTDATLSDILVDGKSLAGFQKNSLSYSITLPAGDTLPPVITPVATDPNALTEVTLPQTYPGTATIKVTAEDRATSNHYQLFVSFSVSGIDVNAMQNSLKVYPNPNNGSFTFEYSTLNGGPIRVSVLDLTGRVVYDHLYEGSRFRMNELIQVPDKQQGAYLIRLIDGMNVTYKKFIVE